MNEQSNRTADRPFSISRTSYLTEGLRAGGSGGGGVVVYRGTPQWFCPSAGWRCRAAGEWVGLLGGRGCRLLACWIPSYLHHPDPGAVMASLHLLWWRQVTQLHVTCVETLHTESEHCRQQVSKWVFVQAKLRWLTRANAQQQNTRKYTKHKHNYNCVGLPDALGAGGGVTMGGNLLGGRGLRRSQMWWEDMMWCLLSVSEQTTGYQSTAGRLYCSISIVYM